MVKIEKLTHEGRGLTHVKDKATFIFGALPTETVEIIPTRRHRSYDEADASTILTASPERVSPRCPHFSLCGGCSMQHAKHDLQIAHKQSVLLEQLQHFGQIKPQEVLLPLLGPIWGYRKKARLGVKYVAKKNGVLVGFRERKSSFLAQLNTCDVLDPKVGLLLTALQILIAGLSVYNQIAQIEVAIDDERAALVFRNLAPLTAADEAQLCAFADQHQLWIYLQPGNNETVYRLWPNKNSSELLSYALPDFSLRYEFHPMDFTQVNSEINRKLVSTAMKLLDPQADETILDLFCGLGNFTLPIARFAKQAVGIEGSQAMVERAMHNAKLNQITNTAFYAANLQTDFSKENWAQQTYDKILLDPPRTGAEDIVKFLPAWKAKRIVYVSCNPATRARDAGILVNQHGYQLTKAGIIDMFPHTSHVESIAVFEAIS
jgi:23S rRNA (uracil1939-C5)-methyltransferase